jgi:hypothetical protein
LSSIDFPSILKADCVDDICSSFYECLYTAMSFIPSNYVTLTSSDKPWITPLLKYLIDKRWDAYRSRNWNLYTHFKIKVKKEIEKAKKAWAVRQTQSAKHVWKVVREIRGSKQSWSLDALIKEFGDITRLLEVIQSELNKNFNWQTDESLSHINDEEWTPQFTRFDVESLLSRLDVRKSAGNDGVPARLLREGSIWLSYPVFLIFSKSIDTRCFPTVWKMADVTPIPKCKKPSPTDFRPISLTPILSKLLERLVFNSVTANLTSLYGASQHAFRSLGSTEGALVKIHDTITLYLEMSNVVAVRMTCLDLSKAFDKVLHNKLLNHLFHSDVNRGFLLWLKSYLSNRCQRLKFNGSFGPVCRIPSGIPQGSILGPVLFACFMGPLSVSSDSTAVLYADDVTLVEPIFKAKDVSHCNFLHVQQWINDQNLSLNLSKSRQLVFFGRGKHDHDVANPTIPVVHNIKMLGVYWNDKLSWHHHFDEMLKWCSQRLFVIRILKPLIQKKDLINVYYSLIASLLLYSSPLFAYLPVTIENKLEQFHNRAHRIICGKDCSCNRFPSLSSLRWKRSLKFLKKCELFPMHPLHHDVPPRMSKTFHFRLPHIGTSRRLRSPIIWICYKMNEL